MTGSWTLRVSSGAGAAAALAEPELRAAWDSLARRDPKVTWFQEAPFVLTWYRAYAGVYEPLVLTGWRGDELVGLLALARRGDGAIVHAGHHHAWYRGWIAAPEIDAEFATAAASEVLARCRPRRWSWGYLPPGAPAGWVDTPGLRAVATVRHAGVWDLRDADAIDRHLGRRLRGYVNRYRRSGELTLERLTEPAAIRRALELVAPWCDLRHGAIHADLPFRDDPRKLPFHVALGCADPSVQTSVLRLDDRPLAVHLGAFDGQRLFLGLYGYDPTEGGQSPGNILMLELARQARADGAVEFDLTPGGEPWKDRSADHHRDVVYLELHGSAAARRVRAARDGLAAAAKSALGRAGLQPDRLRAVAGRLRAPRRPAPRADLYEVNGACLGAATGDAPVASVHGVGAPWLAHLLEYDAGHARPQTSRFLGLALRLLAKGWRPLCATGGAAGGDGAGSTIAWLQPADTRAIVPADPAELPHVGPTDPAETAPGTPVPDDAALLLLAHDAGGAPLPLLVEAARQAARSRLWVLTLDATPRTRSWLQEHGRAIAPEEAP